MSVMTGFLSDKWRNVYPVGYKGNDLELEKENSIYCPTCVPACSDTLYIVRNDAIDLINPKYENRQAFDKP